MKNKKRIVSLAMSFVLLTSVFASCAETEENNVQKEPEKTWDEEQKFLESEYDLVKNGATDYVLVYPENPSTYESLGATELRNMFYSATGVNLQSYTDAEYQPTEVYFRWKNKSV